MRIAYVSTMSRSPWGACEVLWTQSAAAALAHGHQVLASIYDWGQLPPAIAGLQTHGAQLHLRPRDRWSRRSALLSRLRGTFDALESFAPDVVCINQGGTYDISRSGGIEVLNGMLDRSRIPYVLLCHCEQPAPPQRRLARARSLFQKAAVVGVLADRLRVLSERDLQIPLPNARVFHNPVNLPRIELLPWPHGDTLQLAFVGRLEAVKNPALLIDVLADDTWRTREWRLSLYGAGEDCVALQEQVRRAGLTERIRFAGYATDISAIWATHHALLLPSNLEGVPLALIEAMLCGRPAIATDVGGISEWLEEGVSGFLLPVADAGSLAAALERLWSSRNRLETMGHEAHTRTIAKRDPNPAGTLLGWLEHSASAQP